MTLDYDTIFTSSAPLSVAIPGIFAKWFRGKKFIFEARDLWPETPIAMGILKSPILIAMASWLERLAYQTAHRCIGLSPGGVEGICKYGKIDKSKVAMISNAADKAFIDSIEAKRPQEFLPAEDPNGVLLCVYAGAHGPANGLDAVLNVARWLKKENRNDIRLLLIGTGKEKDRLKKEAEEEGLFHVVFYDSRPKPEALAIVKSADVGLMLFKNVSAFYYGTSPNKFFDYISAEIPVLCNYPGWVSGMITEAGCGIAVPPDNAEEFAKALIKFKENPDFRKQAAQKTQTLVPQFDREKLANDFANWVTAV
jgi:glycosyltransferase involved in cell wall biosynthesis